MGHKMCTSEGTVAKGSGLCILGPRESSLGEPDVDPKGNEQEAAELSHASVRKRHCNDTEESSAREENARGEARDAGLHLWIDIIDPRGPVGRLGPTATVWR